MLMLGLILFGGISFSRMGVSQMPDVDFPVINIDVVYEGATPEITETDVVDVIEDAIMSVEGIKEVTSVSQHSRGSILVELDIDTNVDVALQEINSVIAQTQKLLPEGIDPPVIRKRNPEDYPIMYVSLSYEGPLKDLMVYGRHHLKNVFQSIPGVADIRLSGYVDRNMRIWVDRKKLSMYELTVDDILNTIGREHIEVPGGRIDANRQEIIIRAMGEADTVNSVANLPITTRGSSPIYRRILIRDVARVEDSTDDVRRISRFNGRPTLGFGIMKQRKSNSIEVAHAVSKKIKELQGKLPKGYQLRTSIDFTGHVEESTHELIFNIILSVILTSLVCLLFLGSFSSTFNIIFAIPTSLMGTFIVLYFLGYTLNTFTLLALTLVIGIVVDDAIMVMENITRYFEGGMSRVEASRTGARQITFAALAASLAVIAIFLPVAFMEGIIGKYFLQFGVAISVAVAISLLEALTLTPMRCSQFMKTGENLGIVTVMVNKAFAGITSLYRKTLEVALNHRVPVIIVSAVIFLSSFLILIPMKKELVPQQDQSLFIAMVKTPPGSSLEYTDSVSKELEKYLRSRKIIKQLYAVVGGFQGWDSNLINLIITLKPYDKRPIDPEKKRPLTQAEFAHKVRKDLVKINKKIWVGIRDLSMRGLTAKHGFPVEFAVKGTDWDKLGSYSDEIVKKMIKNRMLVDVRSNYEIGQSEAQIIPDRKAAELRGVSMIDIGNTISALMGGKKIGKFTRGGHRYDIRVRLLAPFRKRVEEINSLYVRNNRGELVRLSDVVRIEYKEALIKINRLNRERAVTISASPAPGFSQQEAVDEAMKIAGSVLPPGYTTQITGSSKSSSESFNSLIFALVIGIIISYMILGSQFNSYIHPFTILLALPFSFTGALVSLYLAGQTINLYSLIGLILLLGLVKKNSILLVEFANQLREEGLSVREALMKACPIRLRPIIMTSMATIAAAIPPALALGPGAETRIPMAIAVLGGIVFSTTLTLIVVPCAYSLLSRLERHKDDVNAAVSAKAN